MSTKAAIKITKGGRTAWFYRHAEGHENALGLELQQFMDTSSRRLTLSGVVQLIIKSVPEVELTDEQPDYVYYGYVMDLDAWTLKCYYLIGQAHPGWRDENEVPIRRENCFIDRLVKTIRGNEDVLAYCAGIEREGNTDCFHFLGIGGDRWATPLREADINPLEDGAALTEIKCAFRKMAEKTREEDGV
jgi:hypothetical protein